MLINERSERRYYSKDIPVDGSEKRRYSPRLTSFPDALMQILQVHFIRTFFKNSIKMSYNHSFHLNI